MIHIPVTLSCDGGYGSCLNKAEIIAEWDEPFDNTPGVITDPPTLKYELPPEWTMSYGTHRCPRCSKG
mgnify:CR=1 FL=1